MELANVLLSWFSLILGLCIFIYYYRRRRLYFLASKIPGPTPLPLVGNVLSLRGSPEESLKNMMKLYNEIRYKHGLDITGIAKLWYGPILCVCINNPDMIESFLKSNFQKASPYHLLYPIFGQGIFLQADIPEWKKNRKIIAPKFHFSILKSYIEIFFQEAIVLADKMETFVDTKKSFEPVDMMGLATFNMILRNTLGVNLNVKNTNDHPYLKALHSAYEIFQSRLMYPWLQINFLHKFLGYQEEELKNCKVVNEFVEKLIEEIKQNLSRKLENKTINEINEEDNEKSTSFAEIIIKERLDINNSNPKMTDEQLKDEIITMINGASDTTKTTNSVILNILAVHQDIQDEVYKEIVSVFGDDKDTVPTYAQLQELGYLDRVIKESMRLFPAAPLIARHIAQETKVGDCLIPQGTIGAVFIYGLHRNSKYWDDPEKFDPDRFLPSEIAKRIPNTYIPFSITPRNCNGYKYATIQMKTTISTLLRRFKVLPGETCKTMKDIKYTMNFSLKLCKGNDIHLEYR